MGFGKIVPWLTLAASLLIPGGQWYTPYAIAGIVVAGSLLSASLAEDMASFDAAAAGGAGLRANTRSTQEPIKVLYGQLRVGGNDVYMGTSGEDNKILWIVQTLSEGECEGIYQDAGIDQVFLGDLLYTQYGGNVSYYFHGGTAAQTVDTNLNTALAEWTDCLHYTAYMVWKLTYDRDYFQSLPKRSVVLKGRKLYDFRDASTAYSANPVLALYDYLTNARYGLGMAAAKFDTGVDSSWRDAADYCDTKGWELNIAITKDQAAQDILDAICAHFRGELVWWDGKFYLRYADLNDESSCMTLTDEHIVQDENGKAMVAISEPSRFQKPEGIRVKYTDPDREYIVDDLIIGDETGYIKELKLIGAFRQQAADLGVYYLEREKLDRGITGRFRDDALKLEPHDIVTFTSTALGISAQLMRVLQAQILETNLIELTLLYEALSLYDDDYNLDAEGTYQCSLPDPTAEPPSVSAVVLSEETYNYRLRTFTRLKVTFNPPADYAWFDRVEVRLSFDDATWEHLFDATTDFEIDPVEEGVTYYIRLKVVSIWGTKQKDNNDYKTSRTIGGYIDAPASLAALYAVVNANTINLYADKVADPDVELYEFRLGVAWSGAIFLAALRSPNLSLYGVKPGNHTFLANTLGNNALYGATPRSAAAVLIDPPDGWAVQATETCSYAESPSGTHDNTEHTTYDEDDYLKCSHGGSPVSYSGTYTSPIYDRGSSGRYLVYLLADIVVTGAGTTWDDVIPDPNTWTGIAIDTRTWVEIFELDAGPSVRITLKYGDTSPPTNEVEKQEILSAIVTGRYFQVEITITDPSDATNALIENFTLKFCQ